MVIGNRLNEEKVFTKRPMAGIERFFSGFGMIRMAKLSQRIPGLLHTLFLRAIIDHNYFSLLVFFLGRMPLNKGNIYSQMAGFEPDATAQLQLIL